MFSKRFRSVFVWSVLKICDRCSNFYYEYMNTEILKKRIIIIMIITNSYRFVRHRENDNSIAATVYLKVRNKKQTMNQLVLGYV